MIELSSCPTATKYKISARTKSSDRIIWPEQGKYITEKEYKALRAYARKYNISLSGFKSSDVSVQLAIEVINDYYSISTKYPSLDFGKNKNLTLRLSQHMDANDFATVNPRTPHILQLNVNAYRSKMALEREYAKLANDGWFVRGTNYHHIVFHEYGHIFGILHRIDDMKLAQEVLDLSRTDVIEVLTRTLSEYSVAMKGEIISEVFSAAELPNPPSYLLTYINKSISIALKGADKP